MKKNLAKLSGIVFMLTVFFFSAALQGAYSDPSNHSVGQQPQLQNDFIENGRFLQISGSNPSFDGYNWSKNGLNPVAMREANPNATSISEAQSIFESPFVYVYHALRYKAPWRPGDEKRFPWVEDLGVQVLVTHDDFSLEMPLINLQTLEPGKKQLLIEPPRSI